MSTLREQLAEARSSYLSTRYPGNLGQELLPPRRRAVSWFLPVLASGLAAAATIAIFMRSSPTPLSPVTPAVLLVEKTSPVLAIKKVPPYSLPGRLSLTVPTGPLLPATALTVSFESIPENLVAWQPYHQKLIEQLNRAGLRAAPPVPRSAAPGILPRSASSDAV